jgi:hypothetical protein
MLKKIVGLWLTLEVVFPFFAFYLFITGSRDDVSAHMHEKLSELCLFFQRFPKIEFSGIENSDFSQILGLVTWWMGVISIPILLTPIGCKLIDKKKNPKARINTIDKDSTRKLKDRIGHSLFLIALIMCSCYYVFWGYFTPGPIKLNSALAAAAISLGISFGPAAIILLFCALVIDFIATTPTLNNGALDE